MMQNIEAGIELLQTEVELCLERFSTTEQEDTNTLLELKKTLNLCYCKYSRYSDEYMKFLKNTKTEESLQVYKEHKIEDAKYKNILERALQQMKVSDKDEKESKLTHRSEAHSRTSSNSSSVAIRKRAKAEAAQAKLEFAMKEADLQKQKAHIEEQEKVASAKTITKKAELEAELELLNYKKEAAAATAEADALEYEQNVSGGIHVPDDVTAYLTHLAPDGRASILQPCPYNYDIHESFGCGSVNFGVSQKKDDSIFERTVQDDKPGLSIKDRQFLTLMQTYLQKDKDGNWCSPLPFRTPRRRLPNNRAMVLHRAKSLEKSFYSDPLKQEHIFTFMQKLFECKHAEVAPPLKNDEECWYLPVFGVYHPKKPDKVRCVFDSSASYDNVSLNSVMLRGRDLTNYLVGVHLRFRKEIVGIMADIQQMFYSFSVIEEHRNYLRFLWYEDNNIEKELIEYRMRVHAFGNSPSPAIATYALQKTAEITLQTYGKDVQDFVCRNSYVDDALTLVCNESEAIDLLNRTTEALKDIWKLAST
ncbi:Hypothetical predicted protein [Mytilus galloprovincialis]|uniref:Reverse transcriptase domain-containing protein n=1 Tax=Mytilus galloprovincialis TaxID=29158 RepID=A0A8B6DSN5_MYTGA|nr:Hypothetical predicted protein [Mytilus galloprovincialis]